LHSKDRFKRRACAAISNGGWVKKESPIVFLGGLAEESPVVVHGGFLKGGRREERGELAREVRYIFLQTEQRKQRRKGRKGRKRRVSTS
jgi:hypothetical protein